MRDRLLFMALVALAAVWLAFNAWVVWSWVAQ